MLCDNCHKNEATVHIKQFHDNQMVSVNLCSECAREKEESGELGGLGFNLAEVIFNIGKLSETLKKSSASDGGKSADSKTGSPAVVCPVCGWTPEKMRAANGMLGCPECYRAFGGMLDEVISHIQRGTVHLGKRPALSGGDDTAAKSFELTKLQRELDTHVKREEYEQAAVCRDRINAIRAELAASAPAESAGSAESPTPEAE